VFARRSAGLLKKLRINVRKIYEKRRVEDDTQYTEMHIFAWEHGRTIFTTQCKLKLSMSFTNNTVISIKIQ